MGRRVAWWVVIAVAVAGLVVINTLAPDDKWVGLLEDMIGAVAAVALWVAVARSPRGSRRVFGCMAVAMTCWAIGDLAWDAYAFAGFARPDVSLADCWYLVAYPCWGYALFEMARSRSVRIWREGLLDASILAVTVAIIAWQFLVVPVANETDSWFTAAVWSAYPIGDAVLLGALALLVFSSGTRSAPSALLVAALSTTLVVDVLYSYLPTVSSFDVSRLDPLYPLAYLLMACAVLHPRSHELTAPGVAPGIRPIRFVFLGGALCAAAAVAVGVEDRSTTTRIVFTTLALTLCVLVVVRFSTAIRARDKAQEDLAYSATHDPLTGVVNRVLVLDRIKHALERGRRDGSALAVLYIDLDHFKKVNDTYGHDIGDACLRSVIDGVQGSLRPSDTVGRLGGDEILVVCEGLSAIDTVRIAERVIAAIRDASPPQFPNVKITASIGIALSEDCSATVDALVSDADGTMYEVKRAGGDGYELCDALIRESLRERRDIEDALRGAAANGELIVHYQPMVGATSERVSGFEALVRWRRPDGTLILPDKFIPVAEETGSIIPIGSWVLAQACNKLANWSLDGIDDAVISINVSAVQFRNQSVLHELTRAIARTGADPSRLVLEITESTLLCDTDDVISQLHQIRGLGVRIAVDDFGTGFSSFSYLHRLPIDIIKIDRSLTNELGVDSAADTVLASLIDLAHTLGLEIVADGAETRDQVERLRRLSCDHIQGFCFSRPVPAAAADDIARRGLSGAQRASRSSSHASS